MRRARAAGALGALLALLAAPRSHAWGADGHRVAGELAEALLSPRSRAALAELSGGESLAEIGLRLDRDKRALAASLPGSPRWHFDNHPACAASAPLESYCAAGDCASMAYRRYLAVLADRARPASERRFALEVVVHVLEDVHQPLHVADHDDRGANDVRVMVGRRRRAESLHAAWDIDFVRNAEGGASPRAFARSLAEEYAPDKARLKAGEFGDWVQESYALARDSAYGRLPGFACQAPASDRIRLPRGYVEDATQVVRRQLARAGFRLAAVLDAAL